VPVSFPKVKIVPKATKGWNGKTVTISRALLSVATETVIPLGRCGKGGARRLLERDLGEASEFARVQAFPILGLEFFQCS
jgi:hypothetical protein